MDTLTQLFYNENIKLRDGFLVFNENDFFPEEWKVFPKIYVYIDELSTLNKYIKIESQVYIVDSKSNIFLDVTATLNSRLQCVRLLPLTNEKFNKI